MGCAWGVPAKQSCKPTLIWGAVSAREQCWGEEPGRDTEQSTPGSACCLSNESREPVGAAQ